MAYVYVILSFVSYVCLVYRLRAVTISRYLAAVKDFHQVLLNLDLPSGHGLILKALKGGERSHADHGHQPRVRRPV